MIFRGNMLTIERDAFGLCGMVASQPEQLLEGALSERWGRGRIKFPVCSKICYSFFLCSPQLHELVK